MTLSLARSQCPILTLCRIDEATPTPRAADATEPMIAFTLHVARAPTIAAPVETQAFALYNVFPTHLMHAMPDRLLWFKLQPVSAEKTIVTTYALVHPNTLEMDDFESVREDQKVIMDQINKEDIAVNTMQQIGARSGKVKPGRLNAKLEKALWQLNSWVAAKLTR